MKNNFNSNARPRLGVGQCNTKFMFNINSIKQLSLWLLCLVACIMPQPVATGAVCDKPAVEQVHLSLAGEYSVVVMWNSTTIMTPSVRYALGACMHAPALDEEDPKDPPRVPAPAWRIANGSYNHTQVKGGTGYLYRVRLGNLERGSQYCYVIGDTSCEYDKRRAFSTPTRGVATVAALSDAGTWGNVSYIMNNLANDADVSMVLHPGDLSYGLTEDVWDTFGRIVEPVASIKPYMIIPGNWDVKSGGIKAFLERYTMPLATPLPLEIPDAPPINYYYSFNYSVFHFIMLSSYDDYEKGSPQYKWLEKDLIAANKDRRARPWVVVGVHSPMYSSNSGHGGGDDKFRKAVEPLILEHRVDLVLTGHDHGYERSYPVHNNITVSTETLTLYHNPHAPIHILVGTAGASLDEWLEKPEWSAHREASFGYTKLSASVEHLSVTYIRQDLSIGDQFTITKGRRINLTYVVGVVMVIVFSVLPLMLYKGLPTPVRNFLLCRDDDEENDVTSTHSNSNNNNTIAPNSINKWV